MYTLTHRALEEERKNIISYSTNQLTQWRIHFVTDLTDGCYFSSLGSKLLSIVNKQQTLHHMTGGIFLLRFLANIISPVNLKFTTSTIIVLQNDLIASTYQERMLEFRASRAGAIPMLVQCHYFCSGCPLAVFVPSASSSMTSTVITI